jgi:hypothetical protein
MRSLFSAVVAITLFAVPASAQSLTLKPFASLNFGYQSQSQDLTQQGEFTLYDEAGSFEGQHALDGGGFFEIGGGVGLSRNFSVGISYARRSKATRDVQVTATVPSPIFTDTFRTASATLAGLEHTERAVHIQAMWQVPVTVEFDVTLFAGPSFFKAKDDLVEGVTVGEVGGDFSEVNLGVVGPTRQSNSSVGFNLGVDGRYMVTRNAGIGAMLRYTRGQVDLTSPTGQEDFKIDTGGLEIAGGLRFRF